MKNCSPLSWALMYSSQLLAILVLAGCSGTLLESKKIDYKTSGKLPSLEVPPDLTEPGRDERYVVPDIHNRNSATFSSYVHGRLNQAQNDQSEVLPQTVPTVRLERSGTQRWLVVSNTPDKLWPMLKDFWRNVGFSLHLDSPEAGVMETDWVENRAKLPMDFIRNTLGKTLDTLYSTPERDKFRTRLEKGSDLGTTEIYVSHRGMYEIYINEGRNETRWQPRPADPELEAEMLQRIMIRLGVEDARAKTMLATDRRQDQAKRVRTTDGKSTLIVSEPFDRVWRRVGLALDRIGCTVEDRNRAEGIYFVRHTSTESDTAQNKKNEKDLISKLMFWKTDKQHTKQQDAKLSPPFQILVKTVGDSSEIQIRTEEINSEKSATADKILDLLLEQLK